MVLTNIWRLNDNIIMQDQENIIEGSFVINTVPYIKAIFLKHPVSQIVTITVYSNETTYTQIYSSDTGWINYFYRFWEFKTPLTIPDSLDFLITSNAVQYEAIKATTVDYNGTELFSLGSNQTGTLHCQGRVMKSDIAVKTAPLAYRTVTPTEEDQQVFAPFGYAGYESFTVEKIPADYLVPTGIITIDENRIWDVSEYAEAEVIVPDPPSTELNVEPLKDKQEFTPSAGNYYNKVIVEPIPEEYLIPDGEIEITSNVEQMDIGEYKFLTVKALKAVKGVVYKCIAGEDIEAGEFVEFLINYGRGDLVDFTIDDIKVYKISQEKVLIDYASPNGRELIALYLFEDKVLKSVPVAYGSKNMYDSSLAILNDSTAACLWGFNSTVGQNEQCNVFLQSIFISISIDENEQEISLDIKPQHLVYSSNAGTLAKGISIAPIGYNRVFITMSDIDQQYETTYYSAIKTMNNNGNWSTTLWDDMQGFAYEETNNLIALNENKILSVWLKEGQLYFGIILPTYNSSEFKFYPGESALPNIVSFDIKKLNENCLALITKDIYDEVRVRSVGVNGSTVNISCTAEENPNGSNAEPISLGVTTEECIKIIPISSSRSMTLLPKEDRTLDIHFFYHDNTMVSELSRDKENYITEVTVKNSFEGVLLSYYNVILIYNDKNGSSKFEQLTIYDEATGKIGVKLEESETGTYVYSTTSNTAIVGVATEDAEEKGYVNVVRPS